MGVLAEISLVGWVFIAIVIAALTQVPGYWRERYRESRKPRKFIPGEEPPIFHGPPQGGPPNMGQ